MGPWAPVLVFLLAAGESAAFLGFFLPGEVAVILGGVLAGTGVVPLAVMLPVAIAGAVIGDSVGFWLGDRFGPWVLQRRRLARFAGRIDAAKQSIAKSGWWALVVARFTSVLRAVVPFTAGMATMPYRTFALGNIIGGVLWATTYTLIGYVAGNNWPTVEHWLGRGGLMLAGVVVVALLIAWAGRWVARSRERVVKRFEPIVRTRFARWVARVMERPARRMAPVLYLWPVALVTIGGLWLFTGMLQDVIGQEEFFFFDRRALDYAATHQVPAITNSAHTILSLTPVWVSIAASLIVGVVFLTRRHFERAAGIAIAVAGQWAIVQVTRFIVDRTAPPLVQIVPGGEYGFPSERVAALAVFLVIAAWPWRPRKWESTVGRFVVAAVLVTVIGAAEMVLLLAYPSDVLSGLTVGVGWTVLALTLADTRARAALRAVAARRPPSHDVQRDKRA